MLILFYITNVTLNFLFSAYITKFSLKEIEPTWSFESFPEIHDRNPPCYIGYIIKNLYILFLKKQQQTETEKQDVKDDHNTDKINLQHD